ASAGTQGFGRLAWLWDRPGQRFIMKLKDAAIRAGENELPAIVIDIGLCLVLFGTGAQKIAPTEAEGISPLIVHSLLISWTYGPFGKQGATILIGIYEY